MKYKTPIILKLLLTNLPAFANGILEMPLPANESAQVEFNHASQECALQIQERFAEQLIPSDLAGGKIGDLEISAEEYASSHGLPIEQSRAFLADVRLQSDLVSTDALRGHCRRNARPGYP